MVINKNNKKLHNKVQLRYKQTQRTKNNNNNNNFSSFKKNSNSNTLNNSFGTSMIQKMNSVKHQIEDNFKNELTQLILQNKRLNQTNQKLITELNYSKSKQKLNQSRQTLQQKVFDNLEDWKSQIDIHKQEKIKIQYQNKFLRIRIEDLQKNTIELQNIISLKQNQIIRMRQDRMNIRRQSSQKVLNKSPQKSGFDSSRSKSTNQNKKLINLVENLQKQNNQLRSQNLALKQKCKNLAITNKQNTFSMQNFNQNFQTLSISRKLQYQDKHSNDFHNNALKSHNNQTYNSKNINEQYFSFSRQKQQKYSENSDLPTFPMDLQIQGIIQKHKGNIKAKLDNQGFLLVNKQLLENI